MLIKPLDDNTRSVDVGIVILEDTPSSRKEMLHHGVKIYLFVCSLSLLGCITFWEHGCAADAMSPITMMLLLILLTLEGGRAVNPPGVNSMVLLRLELKTRGS